jgi:DNA-binding MarR family transcriptional regulator
MLREQGNLGDLSESQRAALLRLERDGPMTVSALARAEGMRSQSMGAIVAALEAMGQVTGSSDPNDGRQTILSVTPSFKASLAVSRAARQDWLSHGIQDKFTFDEQQDLARAVALLKRLTVP